LNLVPTIVYDGLTVLGVVSNEAHGCTSVEESDASASRILPRGACPRRRARLACAGLPSSLIWPTRKGAIAAVSLVSGGLFAVAHVRALRWILYVGAAQVLSTTLVSGIGLILAKQLFVPLPARQVFGPVTGYNFSTRENCLLS
jgi:hypothetical protein